MDTELKKLEPEALKLAPGERAALAHRLLASLDQDTEIEDAWAQEVERRNAAVEPGEAPFHTPVYVLTNRKREPWVRPGGTTFYFINDGPERALELARESAGRIDVRIAGGADVIQQYLNLDAVDELEIALAPVLFGCARRLFENLSEPAPKFRNESVLPGPSATHVRYVRQ